MCKLCILAGMTSLRDRQRQVTRHSIQAALAEIIAEQGNLEFSVAEVADRAGVSLRTVYNHYPTRQELFDGFGEWMDAEIARLGGVDMPQDVFDFPAAVVANFRTFEALAEVTEAFARLDTVTAAGRGRARRTAAITEAVRCGVPDLSARLVRAAAVLLRLLGSSRMWYLLTREHGLDLEDAAAVTAWSARTLLDSLRDGADPLEDPDDHD